MAEDRVLAGIVPARQQWQKRESMLQQVFSPEIFKEQRYLRAKVRFYDQLVRGLKPTNGDERLTRDLLKIEQNNLKKQLKQNWFQRMWGKINPFKPKVQRVLEIGQRTDPPSLLKPLENIPKPLRALQNAKINSIQMKPLKKNQLVKKKGRAFGR